MNHFNPILNKYNTVKKKLKAKVTERKELNVQKDKTSISNPIQHIKLNQQLTTITEEIEELKSRKEQLIFQAECSTDKDMTNLSKKYDQMNNNLDILDSQDISLKKQLEKDAAAFREEKFRPEPEQYTELLDTRIQIRPDFRDKLIEQLKGTFGKYYDYHRRDIAANEVDYLNAEDPDVFSHRAWELEYQRKQEMRRNQPARTKKKSYDMESVSYTHLFHTPYISYLTQHDNYMSCLLYPRKIFLYTIECTLRKHSIVMNKKPTNIRFYSQCPKAQ